MFLCSHLLCNKFGLRFRSQFVFRVPLPPRRNFLYGFSPFSSCSSPSPFPSFHNLFSDLLSTILPGIDKGVVQSQISLGRQRDIVLEQDESVHVCSESSVMNNAKNKSARISRQRRRVCAKTCKCCFSGTCCYATSLFSLLERGISVSNSLNEYCSLSATLVVQFAMGHHIFAKIYTYHGQTREILRSSSSSTTFSRKSSTRVRTETGFH
jgi:hypothetical protein